MALALGLSCVPCVGQAQASPPGPAPLALPPVPPGAGLPGAAGSDTLVVRRWQFEGNRALSTAELEALAAPWLDRPLRGLDLEELRQVITRAYVDRGWVSSGAIIPANAFDDGRLRLQIVEGRVNQLRLTGMQLLSDEYVATRLIRPGEVLNVNQLQERFQILLADPLFERLNARLTPDATLGGSILDVDVTRGRSVQASAFANNHLAPAIGSVTGGLELTLRNLSGWGDAFNATLYKSGGSTNTDLAWLLPLGARSTTLALRAVHGKSSVIEEPLDELDIDSVVRSSEISLSHPVIDQTRRRLGLSLSYGERRNSVSVANDPYTFDSGRRADPSQSTRVRSWRFSQDLSLRIERHVLALRSTFAVGHTNVLAETDPLAALPNQANPRYRLWVGQAQVSLAVGDQGASWLLRGSVQRSPDRLVPLERFSAGGRHTVRGYRENQLVRDTGFALGVEFHQPLWREDLPRRSLTLTPFVDAGSAHNRGEGSSRLASLGLGLQWTYGDLEADVQVAKRLERRAANTRGDLQDHGIHLSLRYRLQ